jgi:hypothetical protein
VLTIVIVYQGLLGVLRAGCRASLVRCVVGLCVVLRPLAIEKTCHPAITFDCWHLLLAAAVLFGAWVELRAYWPASSLLVSHAAPGWPTSRARRFLWWNQKWVALASQHASIEVHGVVRLHLLWRPAPSRQLWLDRAFGLQRCRGSIAAGVCHCHTWLFAGSRAVRGFRHVCLLPAPDRGSGRVDASSAWLARLAVVRFAMTWAQSTVPWPRLCWCLFLDRGGRTKSWHWVRFCYGAGVVKDVSSAQALVSVLAADHYWSRGGRVERPIVPLAAVRRWRTPSDPVFLMAG